MKKPKIEKKPEPKPVIEKLLKVLTELEDDTDCDALAEVHEKINMASMHAEEVHNELLDLRDVRFDHKALLKVVSVFLDGVKTVAATGKAKE